MIQDFKEEFIELYGESNYIIVEKLINSACESSIKYKDYINELDGWGCSLDIEKINALNFCYYINLYNEELDVEIDLDFGFGVDMQNELFDYSFEGISEKYKDKEVRILKDIVLDEEKIKEHYRNSQNIIKTIPNEFLEDLLLRKARLIFDREKSNILDLYNKQNYDNYVTGGGTSKTNEFYNKKFKEYEDIGLYWEEIYEFEIVDRILY